MALLEERQTRGYASADVPCGVDRRIKYLDSFDRKLLELTLKGTLTRREAGMLVGLSSGTVSRRVRRLLKRLHEPLIVALVESGKLMPELHQEVGLAYFLRDRTMREIGMEFGLTEYEVKRMLGFVRGWFDGVKGKFR